MSSRKTAPRHMTAITLPGLVDPHDLSGDRQFSMNLARGMEVLRAFTAEGVVYSVPRWGRCQAARSRL